MGTSPQQVTSHEKCAISVRFLLFRPAGYYPLGQPPYCLNQDFQDGRPNPEYPCNPPWPLCPGLRPPPVIDAKERLPEQARGECQQNRGWPLAGSG